MKGRNITMNLWETTEQKKLLVDGHRGSRELAPENTMMAYQHAIDVGVDMLEIDVHMTTDGYLVLMHDRLVDRTTDGTGPITEKSLAQVQQLNAGKNFNVQAPVPMLKEFCQLLADNPTMLACVELKDYPDIEGEEQSFTCAEKTVEMLKEYGILDRCVMNCFDAKVLKHLVDKYGKGLKTHGYYPLNIMREVESDPLEYLYCACLWPDKKDAQWPICPDEWAKYLISRGVEPWIPACVRTADDLETYWKQGARVITTDNSPETIARLKEKGLR